MTNKSIKLLIFILLIITLAELFYYFYFQNYAILKSNSKEKENIPVNKESLNSREFAYHPSVLRVLERQKIFPNTKNYITTETSTLVLDVVKESRKFDNILYHFGIKIENPDLPDGLWLYFTDYLFNLLEVYKIEGESEKLVSYKDINIGNKIIISESYDPSVPYSDEKKTSKLKIVIQ